MKLFVALMGLCALASAETITFRTESDEERSLAEVVPISENLLATVAVVGADPSSAVLGLEDDGAGVSLIGHDTISRLTLLARPEGDDDPVVEFGKAFTLERGDALFLDPENQERVSRLVSWENSYEENVLPISLMRVHHPKEIKPYPGTPLYDKDGKLVALCHQRSGDFGNGSYALPVEVISKVRQDLKDHGRVVRCWIGIVMEVKNAVPAIVTVRPESPAGKAGVKKGDIFLSVGGHEVKSYADTVNAFYYLVSGEETEVTLLRGTQKLSLTIVPEVNPLEKEEG